MENFPDDVFYFCYGIRNYNGTFLHLGRKYDPPNSGICFIVEDVIKEIPAPDIWHESIDLELDIPQLNETVWQDNCFGFAAAMSDIKAFIKGIDWTVKRRPEIDCSLHITGDYTEGKIRILNNKFVQCPKLTTISYDFSVENDETIDIRTTTALVNGVVVKEPKWLGQPGTHVTEDVLSIFGKLIPEITFYDRNRNPRN